MKKRPTRRDFLVLSGTVAGLSLAPVSLTAILSTARAAEQAARASAPYRHLSSAEVSVLAAAADQVFPPDDQPGASELGAVRFVDHALDGFMASALPLLQSGCAELDQEAFRRAGVAFSELPFDDQTAMLEARVSTPFFALVHFLTIAGVFSAARYGGNRDGLGWQMLGFESRHAWQPPFGHYDAVRQAEGDIGDGG